MSELGDLLELMHTAPGRSRSVRLVVREWHHHERGARAFERWANRSGGAHQLVYGLGGGADAESSTTTHSLQWEGSERFREELGSTEVHHTHIRDGERWWTVSPDWGVVSSETERGGQSQCALAHLVEPSVLLAVLRLEPAGEGSVAGRTAREAVGVPLCGDGVGFASHRLGAGADRVELAIDAERGIVLRATASFGGAPFHSFEVTGVAFDESFPPATFVYTPVPGEEVLPPWRPERVQLDEAARRARFTVLAPARVPEGWRLHVTWVDAHERHRLAATAHLHYESEDGGYHVQLRQQSSADERQPDWIAYEQRGDVEVADAGANVQPRHYVRAVRHGTLVELSGDDPDLLLALAAELRPAPAEPPRLP